MKKKNGFTLIELLAILVILTIIAVVTVPIILNVIDNSKKGTITDSAYGYKDAINKYYLTKLGEDPTFEFQNGTYTRDQLKNMGVTISGQEPHSNSWVEISNNEVINGCIQYDENKVVIQNGNVQQAVKGTCEDDSPKLAAVTKDNYGDYIDLGKNIVGTSSTEDDWRIIYNDTENNRVYAILADYFPVDFKENSSDTQTIIQELGLKSRTDCLENAGNNAEEWCRWSEVWANGTGNNWTQADMATFVPAINNTNIWKKLISTNLQSNSHILGASGALDKDIFMASYKELYDDKDWPCDDYQCYDEDKLYFYTDNYNPNEEHDNDYEYEYEEMGANDLYTLPSKYEIEYYLLSGFTYDSENSQYDSTSWFISYESGDECEFAQYEIISSAREAAFAGTGALRPIIILSGNTNAEPETNNNITVWKITE